MRILQIVNRIPWPLRDGGAIGIHYYIEGYLNAGAELSLLCMNTTRHWVDTDTLPPLYQRLKQFEAVKVDNRIKLLAALGNLFTKRQLPLARFISKDFEAALIRMLQEAEYDIIHLDGSYLTPYIATIRAHSRARVVMRLHNIEYRIWERLAGKEKNFAKRRYLTLLTKRLKDYETVHANDYDLALPISREDAALFREMGYTGGLHLHPFGVSPSSPGPLPGAPTKGEEDVGRANLGTKAGPTQATAAMDLGPDPNLTAFRVDGGLYHLGAMDWLPNQESVDWLLEKVWPLVMRENDQLKLSLAGRNMPERYRQLAIPGVDVVGEVPDAAAFEADKQILLVPLQSGGGVRIKIFQGMAAGKTVIATPVGIEGIDAVDGIHALIAETPEAFAEKILQAAKYPEAAAKIGRSAQRLIAEHYDRRKLMAELMEVYAGLLQSNGFF